MLWHHIFSPNTTKTVLAASFMMLMTACGSGSQSDTTGSLTINNQPVSGMSYSSPSYTGVTDNSGTFNFKSGETMTFTIYGLEFGETTAQKTITMADFEEAAIPSGYHDFQRYNQQSIKLTTLSNIDDGIDVYANPQALDRLNNRLFLLYSLDADNNADNGIDLTQLSENDLPQLLFQVSLPINLNTFEFSARMYSRAKLLNYNDQYSGFNALAKFLSDRNVTIDYPEAMCRGTSYNNAAPTQWSVSYKSEQQNSILEDTFTSCPSIPTSSQAQEYASTYSTDGLLNTWYEYDDQNRLTHQYRNTDGTMNNYSQLYETQYTEVDGLLTVIETKTDIPDSTKIIDYVSTSTYLENGLLKSIFRDDETDTLKEYYYTEMGKLETELYYTDYYGDISAVAATDTLSYDANGLLLNRSDVETNATNTYDYAYNHLGQTLSRKHNVDAKTDTDPDTINYEYELTASFNSQGNPTSFENLSRWYDGSLANYQQNYVYTFDEQNRIKSNTHTRTNHNNNAEVSTTLASYVYNDEGLLSDICYDETCESSLQYTYTENGLIETVTRLSSNAATYKAYYFYNSEQLISNIHFFDGANLTGDHNPNTPESPDLETVLDYFSSGAISFLDESIYKTYYHDPDSESDSSGYYQWFNIDLGEHLNRTLKEPTSFNYYGGDT